MTEKEVYQIWAPPGNKWVGWVRPVAFIESNLYDRGYLFTEEELPDVDFLDEKCKDAALIVDLPGSEGVYMGISLAKKGYRPIPVYNGTIEQTGAKATVDNTTVGKALRWGAGIMRELELKEDAPPAFLTDSNRLNSFRQNRSMFDNSWDLYAQDLPTAEYLMASGIRRVVVVGDRISKDLKPIFYKYYKKGLDIMWAKNYASPVNIRVLRPLYPD